MTSIRRLITVICRVAIWLMITLLILAIYLLTTTSGLKTSLKLAHYVLPGQLIATQAQGQLIHRLRFKTLSYQSREITVNLTDVKLKWQPIKLLAHQFWLSHVKLGQAYVDIKLKQPKSPALSNHNAFKLPLAITAKHIVIDKLTLVNNNLVTTVNHLKLNAQLSNDLWQVSNLEASYLDHKFQLNADLLAHMPYTAHATLAVHPELNTQATSSTTANFKLSGNYYRYHWQGSLSAPLKLAISGELNYGHELNTSLSWQQLSWPLSRGYIFNSNQGKAQIQGNLDNLTLTLTAQVLSPLASTLLINAHTDNGKMVSHAQINANAGNLTATINYQPQKSPYVQGLVLLKTNHTPTPLIMTDIQSRSEFSGNSLATLKVNSHTNARYLNHALTLMATFKQQAVKAHATLGSNYIDIDAQTAFPWQFNILMPEPGLLHPALNGLKTTLGIKGDFKSLNRAALTLNVSKGQLIEKNNAPLLIFEGGKLHADLTPKGLQSLGQFTLDNNKKIALELSLPNYLLGALKPNQRLNGKLDLTVDSLAFIDRLTTVINKTSGQLQALIKLSGTWEKPIVTGNVKLNAGSFIIPAVNLNVNPVNVTLKTNQSNWQLDAKLATGNQPLTIQGRGELKPELTGLITIQGDHVLLMNSTEYQIDLSPKLSVELAPSTVKLRGTIVVPKAQIKPQTFTETVSLSDDVKFTDTQQSTTNPLNLDMDIGIVMGSDVTLAIKGLQGNLVGSVNLKQFPQGLLTAVGELNIKQGNYQAYGQNLIIDQGQLIFSGGAVDDPSIRIRAIRKFDNATNSFSGSNQLFDFNAANVQTLDFGSKTTVGIEVVGRLSTPQVKLFSVPSSLSQADILSMLLLGKPASQANKAGGQLLLTAVSALKLDSTDGKTQLLDQLKENLGFDFNLANTSQYNQKTNQSIDNTSFVVGKSLSKRLYLSYNIGLTQADTNMLVLKYLLNKFFSIQVNASSNGNGADILYTHEQK